MSYQYTLWTVKCTNNDFITDTLWTVKCLHTLIFQRCIACLLLERSEWSHLQHVCLAWLDVFIVGLPVCMGGLIRAISWADQRKLHIRGTVRLMEHATGGESVSSGIFSLLLNFFRLLHLFCKCGEGRRFGGCSVKFKLKKGGGKLKKSKNQQRHLGNFTPGTRTKLITTKEERDTGSATEEAETADKERIFLFKISNELRIKLQLGLKQRKKELTLWSRVISTVCEYFWFCLYIPL